jgi:hypothetical protein
MRRSGRPLACAAVLALLLTGCGGSDDGNGSATGEGGGTAEPAPSAAAPADPSVAPSVPPEASAAPPVEGQPAIEGLEVLAEDPSHEHVEGPVEYDRIPPLGGPHNPRWLACDVYDEPVPLEFAVHSIEHGGVWIAYAPDLPAEQVEQLAELASLDEEYVLVAPQDGLDSRVVAVTWGAGLEASSAGDPRLRQFVEAYAGGPQGGEPGAPCRTNGLSLDDALGALDG